MLASPAHPSEEIQRRFSEAMLSIERDPKTAVELLSGLTNKTDAIRVKLELARALYLSGQLHDSKNKFVEVLKELPADAPPQVRANVERFLIDINRKLNPVSFGLSIVRDSNPTQSAETRKVTILGLEFDYTPQTEVREEYGLRLTGDLIFKVSERAEFAGLLAHTQYETSDNTRSLFVPEFRYLLSENRRLWARLGFEYEGLNKKTLRQSPFIALRKLDDFPAQKVSTMLEIRYVSENYPAFSFANGRTIEAQFFGKHQISPSVAVNAGLGFEDTSAREEPYASRLASLSYGLSFPGLLLGIDLNLGQRHLQRRYEGEDLFFGVRRDDRDLVQSLSFQKKGFYIWGILPTIELIREKRKSNIGSFEFDRTQAILSGTKLF